MKTNFEVMDFEVVGVRGWRREEIKRQRSLKSEEPLILLIHKGGPFDENLFAAALKETVSWLKPSQITHQIWPLSEWQQQLDQAAQSLFPVSFAQAPQEMKKLVAQYNQEKPLSEWLFLEHYCYLPFLARRQKVDVKLDMMIRYEVNRSLLEIRDFGKKNLPAESLRANETIELYQHLDFEISFFERNNISVLFVNPRTLKPETLPLIKEEARILDLLEEGLELSFSNLVSVIREFEWGIKKESQYWQDVILRMIEKGLILFGNEKLLDVSRDS